MSVMSVVKMACEYRDSALLPQVQQISKLPVVGSLANIGGSLWKDLSNHFLLVTTLQKVRHLNCGFCAQIA